MSEDQINLHPSPLGKPNGLTVEGLARVIVAMQKDIEWIKKDSEERKKQLSKLDTQLTKAIELLNSRVVWERSIDQAIDEIRQRLNDHENRIRATERHDWMEIGIAAAVSGLLSSSLILLILRLLSG